VLSVLQAVFIHFLYIYKSVGGVLLALIEGVGILITRWSADQFKMGTSVSDIHCYHSLYISFLQKTFLLNFNEFSILCNVLIDSDVSIL